MMMAMGWALHPGSTICVFNSDYNGQYVTLGYADPVPTFDKTGLGEESRHLKFKNMVQAIILDLIDRGYIAYSQENVVDTLRMKEILFVKKDSVSGGSLLKMEEVLLKV